MNFLDARKAVAMYTSLYGKKSGQGKWSVYV